MNIPREKSILSNLLEDEYISSEQLASLLEVSSKTIRNDIKIINQKLQSINTYIAVRPKHGCKLVVGDRKAFNNYLITLSKDAINAIPSNAEERVEFLLEMFLNTNKWIKIEDLCDQLYISQSSLSKNLKEVRNYLLEYNLELESRSGHGLKIKGREFDMRLCMANLTLKHTDELIDKSQFKDKKKVISTITSILDSVFIANNYRMSDVSLQNLIIHIFIALHRIEEGKEAHLNIQQLESIVKEPEFVIAQKIADKLTERFAAQISKDEVAYIAIHLAAKKIVSVDKSKNIVITDDINEIVTHMLDAIEEAYQIDFHDDFELRMMLGLHLVPFEVRMAYDLVLHNPLLMDIKTNYTLAYNLAVSASDELRKYYSKDIKEDEIGYFALHFNLALERKKEVLDKKNILIVCGSGHGTAQLLFYRFQENFGKYLNHIETCDSLSIRQMNFESIDYVITTVPINDNIPVPILEIKSLMGDKDLKNIHRFLRGNKPSAMKAYFNPELFLTDVEVESKEEALDYIVKHIKKVKKNIPDNFYEAIIHREQQAVTEFGNLVAIPHPYKAITEDTFVCICILKKPILWEKKKVQLIYLTSMEIDSSRDLILFYKITSKLLVNDEYIREIIQKKNYNYMLKLFSSIEEQIESEEK